MNLVVYSVALTPVVIGLVQICKESGLASRLCPLASLLFGILAGVASVYAPTGNRDLLQGVIVGVALGLASSGAFSGISAMVTQQPITLAGVKPLQPMQPIADPNGIQIAHATLEGSDTPVTARAATPVAMVSTSTPSLSPVAASPVEAGSTADSAV